MFEQTLVSFPPERRADGCFHGMQHVWVSWYRAADGAVILTGASEDPAAKWRHDLLPYYSDEKRAEMVRQIVAREEADRVKRGWAMSDLP